MSKKAFDKIAAGLEDAIAFAEGRAADDFVVHVPEEIDVLAIRKREGLTQAGFAKRYSFKIGAVRDWEQKRKRPLGPTRLLLKLIQERPDVVREVLDFA
jgi:putative transcriptional regulator